MSKISYMPSSVDALARAHTAEAMGVLVEVARHGLKDSDRVAAAKEILDRGHGKATQAVISIPVRQAVASKLAALDDAALLAIAQAGRMAQEGGIPQEGGPNAPLVERDPSDPFARLGFKSTEVTDGEFTDVTDVLEAARAADNAEPREAAKPNEFPKGEAAPVGNPWD